MPAARPPERGSHGSPPPVRVLAVIPCPSDGPGCDAEALWHELQRALKPLADHGLVGVERLEEASEGGLKRRLAEAPPEVLHFLGTTRSRPIANYEALLFEGSDGRARSLTAQYLATLLRRGAGLRLAVLQPSAAGSSPFDGVARMLVDHGLEAVVTTGHLSARPQAVFAAKLYSGLATGSTLEEAVAAARHALAPEGPGDGGIALVSRSPTARLGASGGAREGSAETPPPSAPAREPAARPGATGVPASEVSAGELAVRRELERKRVECAFDVFLCHNNADKPEVRKIARRLKERGILPWLDEWELPPGQPWQTLLEQQIGSIRSAAVFVGSAGVGPWQEQELYGFLREFVSRRSPVIPVLLPDAPEKPELPIFLKAMTWVDFRAAEPEPLGRLIWGITGQRPEALELGPPSPEP